MEKLSSWDCGLKLILQYLTSMQHCKFILVALTISMENKLKILLSQPGWVFVAGQTYSLKVLGFTCCFEDWLWWVSELLSHAFLGK